MEGEGTFCLLFPYHYWSEVESSLGEAWRYGGREEGLKVELCDETMERGKEEEKEVSG